MNENDIQYAGVSDPTQPMQPLPVEPAGHEPAPIYLGDPDDHILAEAVDPAAPSPDAPYPAAPPPDDALYPNFWSAPEPIVHKRRKGLAFLAWLLAVVLGATGGAGGAYYFLKDKISTGGIVKVAPAITKTGLGDSSSPVAAVARAVLPSLVRIDIATTAGQRALGSGVLYRSDGYIVTNNHVVEGADQIVVHLPSGKRLDGVLVGTAAPTVDIAVVKVAAKDLPTATFGTIKDVAVGDLAVALGSPFGLDATVTAGVISALHRNEPIGNGSFFPEAIQTDAPINPGNSGGALANDRGEVIGINTAIAGGTGGNVGVGFAIPIDIVRKVADQIIQTGSAHFPFLGIGGDSLPDGAGARINDARAGGPADQAGLKADDVITAVDGQKVTSMEALIALLIEHNVGDKIEVTYVRAGTTRTATVTLAARPGG